MFHLFRDKYKASSLSKKDAGPFSPEFFEAFLTNKCMKCGGAISDIELFGNGLVVEPKRVVLNCRKCRVGLVNHNVANWLGKCDANGIIYQIHQHKCHKTNQSLSWFQVLVCLRMIDPRSIMTKGSNAEEFLWEGHPRRKLFYADGRAYWPGKLMSVYQCQDCLAHWREFDAGTYDMPTFKEWSDTSCYICNVKHDDQYHMRITAEAERELLISGQSVPT